MHPLLKPPLARWLCWLLLAAALAACGDKLPEQAPPEQTVPPPAALSPGTGQLRESVTVIDATRSGWVAAATADRWTLRGGTPVPAVGAVLLLLDDAVRVTSVDSSGPAPVLGVVPAEIEEVFSRLNLTQALSLAEATFEPEGDIPAVLRPLQTARRAEAGPGAQPSAEVGVRQRVQISIEREPFSGELNLDLMGQLAFEYDEARAGGTRGSLDVTGSVNGLVLARSQRTETVVLPETQLGIIRIPIPFTVVDRALRVLGVRVASLMIPVKLGGEVEAGYAVAVRLSGNVDSRLQIQYDQPGGLRSEGPTLSAGFSVVGELPGTGPDAALRISFSGGPYVRARPQLLILNQVASMGADVKVGMYVDGEISAYPSPPPYFCVSVQPRLKSEVHGFFKAVGVGEVRTPTLPGSLDVGAPYRDGECREEAQIRFEQPTADTRLALDGTPLTVAIRVAPLQASGEAPVPQGLVTMSFQDASCETVLTDGAVACELPVVRAGSGQVVTVAYAGDTVYRPTAFSTTVDVDGEQNQISITQASCSLGGDGYGTATLRGTATGEVGAAIIAYPTSTIGDATRFSHQCTGWTGVVHYFGYTHCLRLEGDPPGVTWTTVSATVPGNMNLDARLVSTVNGQFPSHVPPLLAIDIKTGFTCPGSFNY